MTTKITVEIHKSGTINDNIIRMITNHNEGLINVTPDLIRQRYKCYFAEWPTISPTFEIKEQSDSLEIWERDKHVFTIQWKEIHELEPANDIPEQLFNNS